MLIRRRGGKIYSPSEVSPVLYAALGRNDKNTCLVDSLVRFYFLQGNKNVTLNIGALVPTHLMHAWIEVNSEALHECPDRLIHFSKAVSFHAGG